MNVCHFSGRITKDAEIKTSASGMDIATFTLAVDCGYGDKKRTEFINCKRFKPGGMAPYPPQLRKRLLALLEDPSRAEREPLTELEQEVTDAFAAAVEGFLRAQGLDPSRIDLVGNHGQTVFHRPETRFTRQLSDGGRMARRLGIPVVDDFRTADVKAGGQAVEETAKEVKEDITK